MEMCSRFWKFLKIKDGIGTMLKISKEHIKIDLNFGVKRLSKRRSFSELIKTKVAEKVTANEKLNDKDSSILTCSNQMGLTVESTSTPPIRLAPTT